MKIVIAGGGTAGHVNPAIALAKALEGDQVSFIGTTSGAEARLVPGVGLRLEPIEVRGFDRARPASIFPTAYVAARAVITALVILRRIRPDVVVGMGGYVSLPVCVAAAIARIPIVLHEQNIVLGLANRVCKALAASVAVSFEETLATAGPRGVFVGNPVLPDVAGADVAAARLGALERFGLEPGRKTLLVFGGSQGARRLNDAAFGLVDVWGGRRDRQVLHIVGRVQSAELPTADPSQSSALLYRTVDYVDRMVDAYATADVALCRGGATTVAELTAVGLPAVIVPYPYHRDRQQERHGKVLERAGAAVVLRDEDTSARTVAGVVDPLFADDAQLETMRKAALSFGRPDAAARLAVVVRGAAR